jgi:3-oxoacyl-[acyl-carrier-protein] synthase-3
MAGIIDFEVRFPESRSSVRDMHELSGVPVEEILQITHCDGFPVLGPQELAWELTLQASRCVLERAGVPPDAIGQIVYAGSGLWDTPLWSPAAKVADELGVRGAHCFEVTNFCNAGTTAMRIALDAVLLGRATHTLVLIGDRLSHLTDYEDPDSRALFNAGDAAAAVLMARERCAFEVLHTAARTDPSWSDYYAGEYADERVIVRRRGFRMDLAEAYFENFAALLDDTLAAVHRDRTDVAWFLVNQNDREMHERLLRTIGIPAERSVFNYDRLGHMGCADTLIALHDLRAQGRLRPGDLVLLATSGMGFSWGITALEHQG